MLSLLIVGQIVLSVILIVVILMQKGKGAEMGVSFGAGASDTVFGASGPTPFLAKLTWFLAFLFMLNSLSITYIIYNSRNKSVVNSATPAVQHHISPKKTTHAPITK